MSQAKIDGQSVSDQFRLSKQLLYWRASAINQLSMVSALKAILASARSPGFAIPAFLHAPARAMPSATCAAMRTSTPPPRLHQPQPNVRFGSKADIHEGIPNQRAARRFCVI